MLGGRGGHIRPDLISMSSRYCRLRSTSEASLGTSGEGIMPRSRCSISAFIRSSKHTTAQRTCTHRINQPANQKCAILLLVDCFLLVNNACLVFTSLRALAYPGFYNGGGSQVLHRGLFQKAAEPGSLGTKNLQRGPGAKFQYRGSEEKREISV